MCAVIPVAGQRTHETTFRALKVTSQVATPAAESAVYDCLAVVACRLAQGGAGAVLVRLRDTAVDDPARRSPSLLSLLLSPTLLTRLRHRRPRHRRM